MTANATILTAQRTSVLRIPNAAFRVRPPDNIRVASTNDAVAKAAGTNRIASARGSGDLPMPPWAAKDAVRLQENGTECRNSLTPGAEGQYRQQRERMRAAANTAAAAASGEMESPGSRPRRPATPDGPTIRLSSIPPILPEPWCSKAVSGKDGHQ